MKLSRLNLLLALSAVALLGCAKKRSLDERAASRQALEQGLQAYEAGDAERAFELLTQAIEGWLQRNDMGRACQARAICAAKLQKFDVAEADLNALIEVAPDMATFHAIRSYVLQKQGKSKEAKAAFRLARRMNRRIEQIKY